jgi:hypothetical protein
MNTLPFPYLLRRVLSLCAKQVAGPYRLRPAAGARAFGTLFYHNGHGGTTGFSRACKKRRNTRIEPAGEPAQTKVRRRRATTQRDEAKTLRPSALHQYGGLMPSFYGGT